MFNNKKGFSTTLVITVVVLIVLAGGGVFYLTKLSQQTDKMDKNIASPTSTPTISSSAVPTTTPVGNTASPAASDNSTNIQKDMRIKSDLQVIRAALSAYRNAYGSYPQTLQMLVDLGDLAKMPTSHHDGS